jgi:hypothetical protein
MENPIHRARSMEEFLDLVKEALLETEELRASIEYDEESMSEALGFVNRLQTSFEDIRRHLDVAPYPSAGEDLDFMSLGRATDERLLPFKQLLIWISDTHPMGLDKG